MAVERVEDQRPRSREHGVHVPDDEDRPDLASLPPLARELHGQLDDLLQRPAARLLAPGRLGDRAEDLLEAVDGLHRRFNGNEAGKIPA